MERRMFTVGVAAVLLLASFALTAFTAGGEESSTTPNPDEVGTGLQQPLDQGGAPDLNGPLSLSEVDLSEVTFSPVESEMIDPGNVPSGVRSWRSDYYSLDQPTRASDAENEVDQHDFANGSKLSSASETIDGTLTYDPDQGGSPDWRDWYKFSVDDINELANTVDGVRNVSIILESFTDNNDGYAGLYEFTYDNDGITSEYADVLEINLIYFDPWAGYTDMGSNEFLFDDQDDTDGWVWDGDNLLYPGDNWTTNFVTPVNSDGDEDPDGFANGHTEVGWYYVGIGLNFYFRDQPLNRDAFTLKYSFTIDTTKQEPTDQGSNAQEDALDYGGSEPKQMHSRWNQVDWYKMGGLDPNKLWNISFTLNRTMGEAGWWRGNSVQGGDFLDNWLWTFVVWRNPGDDEEWGTDDDGWTYDYLILAFGITGGRFVSNAEQELGFFYHSWAIENPEREVYIGIIMEPVMMRVASGGNIEGYYYYAPIYLANEYHIEIDIMEEVPNHSPTISDLEISSDWPGHETGGHFGSTFYFNITYTDEDNDPPEELNMVFDQDSPDEVIYDMLQYEVDSGDTDYTDGKDYSYMVLGEDLEEYLIPPVIMVNASDTILIESIRIQGFTDNFYYNNTLYVWDDDPVYLNPTYEGEESLSEDEEYEFFLQGNSGLIIDPDNNYLGFQAWNETAEEWKTDYDSDLLSIKVQQVLGEWKAIVIPKSDQNGEETVTFRGFDVYSNITGDVLIIVDPVNDLPVVQSVEVDGDTYDVDNTRPDYPEIHLETQVTVLEDSEIVIEVIVNDIDNEISELSFALVERDSDDWKGEIAVDGSTGDITLTPNNNDVRMENSIIVVSIDDGGTELIFLKIFLEMTNVNDKPNITLSPALDKVYEKDDEISITPTFTDPDQGDVLTVSVNMEVEMEGVDPIVDQLPNADLEKGADWDFNENIGRLWIKLDDWKIWQSTTGFVGVVNITLVFQVTDGKLTDEKTVTLRLEADEPGYPTDYDDPVSAGEYSYSVHDEYPDTPSKAEGLEVNFKFTGTLLSVFGDEMEPRWEYDGEVISSEKDFDHTFETPGLKSVYLYFVKDNVDTTDEKITLTFTLYEVPIIDDDDDDDDDEKNKTGDGGFPVIPVVIIVIIILIIVVLIALFYVMRRKQQPQEAGQEYYDETPRFGGRGHSQELGAQPRTHGLSPAREADHTEKLLPKKEAAPGMSCPHCGASVQKGWFLCPECKNPLD